MARPASFHEQLIEKLRKLLRSRQFTPGAKFLTEREIALRLGTSHPTANKALSSLVSTGLLEFCQGADTFVRASVLDYDLQRLVSFTEKAAAAGRKPGTRVLAFRKITAADAPAVVMHALKAQPSDPLFFIEHVRLAVGSLYAFWTKKCRLTISGADESIRAVNATAPQAAALGISPHTACLLVITTGFLAASTPLWHEETLYCSDVYEFRNQLGGLSAPKPALGHMR